MRYECEHCGGEFVQSGRGRSPRFCSSRCRTAAHRARRKVIPVRLRQVDRWTRADGKRPVQVDGRAASSTDSATWAGFSEVQSGAGDGFGVMLGGGLACWDLDHCLEGGELASWAVEVLEGIESPLFVERSVSGTGLHVFVEAPEGPGWRRGGVEFYSQGRFIRVTGDRFGR